MRDNQYLYSITRAPIGRSCTPESVETLKRLLSERDAKIKRQQCELSEVRSHGITVRNMWVEALEDVQREHEKLVTRKDNEIAHLKQRAKNAEKELRILRRRIEREGWEL